MLQGENKHVNMRIKLALKRFNKASLSQGAWYKNKQGVASQLLDKLRKIN